MKATKKLALIAITVVLLTVCFIFGASALNATGKCGKDATYTFDSATGELVISGTGAIAAEAFYNNKGIKHVIIGDGITEIGADAFGGSSITSLDISDSLTTIGDSAFSRSNLSSIYIGDSVTTIGASAFEDCDSLTSVTIPDSVTTIGNYAFYSCCSLTSVTIGNSVTTIGASAFAYCNSLTSVTIPDSVTTIGAGTFYYCINLTSATIGNSVTTIDGYAFASCHNVASVTVGNSVETIYNNAFYECKSLESINIPKTVTSIGQETFHYCTNLTDVYYEGAEENWNAIEIYENNTALENATIHFGETHTHTWDVEEITIYPTCTEKGEKTISCKGAVCKKTEEIPALGHDFIYYYSNGDATCAQDGTKTAECNRCWSEKDTIVDVGSKDKVSHKFEAGKCTVCGAYTGSCQHQNLSWYAAVLETCSFEGFKEHYECKDCGDYLDANKVVYDKNDLITEKLEHKFTKYNVIKDATCTANAIEKASCDVCGEATHERGMPGTMIAHTFKDYKSDGNATCKVDGTMTAVCDMCKEAKDTKTEVDSHKTAPHTPDVVGIKCTLCGAELVCVHTYFAEKLITKTPTCTEKGQKAIVCSKCKANKPGSEEEIAAIGHDYKKTTFPVSCAADGYDLFQCQNCNHEYKDNWVTDRQHNYVEIKTDATCSVAGIIACACSTCGATKESVIIPALGHNYGEKYVMVKAPTCTTEGSECRQCVTCGKVSDFRTLPALGHLFTTEKVIIISPTCKAEGKKAIRCERCHTIEEGSEEVIPATHNYPDNWSVLVEPDCETKGINVKICLNCNDLITQKLPKAGHADKDGDSKCDTCDKEIIVTEPDEPTEPDTPDEPEVPEEKPCSCDCHAGGIKAFFFKLINFFAKIFDKSARVCECGKSH